MTMLTPKGMNEGAAPMAAGTTTTTPGQANVPSADISASDQSDDLPF